MRAFASFLCLFLMAGSILWAQAPNTLVRPSTHAIVIEQEPDIDGEVLNDPIWQTVEPVTDMTQIKPDQGQPASEKTEIRIAYTPSVFYLSVVCFDMEPRKLVVTDARRDASLDGTDSFLFILDTYNDGQNGFLFLQGLVDSGFGDRIMFGSDQMVWVNTIDEGIEAVNSATFLSMEQKENIFYDNAARFLGIPDEEIKRHKSK